MFFRLLKRKEALPSEEKIHRAQRASALLHIDSFHEALDDVENEIWESFFSAPADDVDAQCILYQHVNALKMIKVRLEQFVEAGRAEEIIEKQNKGR